MKIIRGLASLLLCGALLVSLAGAASAEGAFRVTLWVGEEEKAVRAFEESYSGNLYLSLADLSAALSGTEKQFRLSFQSTADGDVFSITSGQPAATASGADQVGAAPSVSYLILRRNLLYLDGTERKYYTARVGQDLYMSLGDVQLLLDVSAEALGDGSLRLELGRPFVPDLETLAEEGYFDVFNGVLLGDADTGELLFTHAHARTAPIASLSKLMTYLLLAEAAEAGDIAFDDTVTISAKAAALSQTQDGMVTLTEGAELPFDQLLSAMLLASSNECALALAEHAMGSEEAFVARMNERAAELKLHSAKFYTPHGLPSYTVSNLPAKRQNRMSAFDLFRLTRYLLEHHPEITDITAQQYGILPALNYGTANSNPLVFNLEGVNGLKTGSTNKAGYCLIATLPVTVGEETHTVVMVLLGAEDAPTRNQAAQLLLVYARAYYAENGFLAQEAA